MHHPWVRLLGVLVFAAWFVALTTVVVNGVPGAAAVAADELGDDAARVALLDELAATSIEPSPASNVPVGGQNLIRAALS